MGFNTKVFTALLLINFVSADYQLTIALNSIKVKGTLPSGDPCSPFSGLGVNCFPRPKICIEPGEYITDNKEQCSFGSYIDLGIGNNTNDLVFAKNAYYGGWYNPMTFNFFGTFTGFSIKLYIWNADGTNYQEIDYFQWNLTDSDPPAFNKTDPRETSLNLQWSFEVQTMPTALPTSPTASLPPLPNDCGSVTIAGPTNINIGETTVTAYCDGNGGIAIQRRLDGTVDFKQTFANYKNMIGTAATSYWLGLDNINSLTSSSTTYSAVITVCCKTSATVEHYDSFKVGGASDSYKLNVISPDNSFRLVAKGGYTNTEDNGSPFSTFSDFNNVNVNKTFCASALGEGGWWFGSCENNLNGHYYDTYVDPTLCTINPATYYSTTGAGISYPVQISFDKTQIVLYPPQAFKKIDYNVLAQDFCT